jgi:hypothetical protein
MIRKVGGTRDEVEDLLQDSCYKTGARQHAIKHEAKEQEVKNQSEAQERTSMSSASRLERAPKGS